jgi:hypothetical protein
MFTDSIVRRDPLCRWNSGVRPLSQDAPSTPQRRSRWLPRLMLAVAPLLLAFAGAELWLRVGGGTPWYERLVTEQTHFAPTLHQIGFMMAPLRAALPADAKTADEYRIVFLGDSFTYGEGVQDGSKTFPKLIESALNREPPAGGPRRYSVFNGGIPASLTEQWAVLGEEALKAYHPDLIVAVFFLRDGVANVTTRAPIENIREQLLRLNEESPLFRYCRTYRYFRERGELARLSRQYLDDLRTGYLGAPEQMRQWERARRDLLRIRDGASRAGVKFALVVFPVLFELNENYPLTDVCQTIERFGADNSIPTFSLLPAFLGQDAASLWVSPLDQHPNEHGHALAAQALERFVRERIGTN